jgi:amidase
MGGSIRIPSSLCGLYGFKAPFGRVPTSEISYETLGPMARNFEDMVLMQNCIAGPHPKVHASLRPKLEYPHEYASVKGVPIAVDYFGDWIQGGVDASVRDSLGDAVDALRKQGAIVDEVKLGWTYQSLFRTFVNGLMSTGMGMMLLAAAEHKDKVTTYTKHFLDFAKDCGPSALAGADELTTRLHREVQDKVYGRGYQALIMPTLATPYFPADNDPTKDTVTINGKPVGGLAYVLTAIWNLLSRYPVVDVPVGIAPNNIPIGMQVVGNTFDDLAAFRVAAGYSQAGLQLYSDGKFPKFNSKA